MSHSEGSRGEDGGHRGVDGVIVTFQVSILQQHQVVLLHDFTSEHHREEFVVGDLLLEGGNDGLGLLEEGLVGPMGVDLGQLLGDTIVFTGKDGVEHSKDGLFIDTGITYGKKKTCYGITQRQIKDRSQIDLPDKKQ